MEGGKRERRPKLSQPRQSKEGDESSPQTSPRPPLVDDPASSAHNQPARSNEGMPAQARRGVEIFAHNCIILVRPSVRSFIHLFAAHGESSSPVRAVGHFKELTPPESARFTRVFVRVCLLLQPPPLSSSSSRHRRHYHFIGREEQFAAAAAADSGAAERARAPNRPKEANSLASAFGVAWPALK